MTSCLVVPAAHPRRGYRAFMMLYNAFYGFLMEFPAANRSIYSGRPVDSLTNSDNSKAPTGEEHPTYFTIVVDLLLHFMFQSRPESL